MSTLSVQNLTLSSQIIELAQLGEHSPNLRPNTIQNTAAIKTPELASIILAVIVFAGSLATALCVVCVRYKRWAIYINIRKEKYLSIRNIKHKNEQKIY